MSKPWAGYVRVSHVGGRGGDRFHSPEQQAEVIAAWAHARKDKVVLLQPELDESGGRADRPILTQAIEGIEAGQYCGLLVAYLSRASRSTRHLLELWDRVESAGGQVIAVAENIDTSTPSGRLTRTMLAAIAEHELDLHRERFELLRKHATERGIWQRRQTPTGYDRDPDTRRLVPNSDAEKVVDLFQRRAAGAPLVRLAEWMGMSPQGVRGLTSNRVYLGELKVGPYVNEAAHPAIVTDDMFLAAQHVKTTRPARGPGLHPALLAGLVRCCGCGHLMTRTYTTRKSKSGKTGRQFVYRCNTYHSAGRCQAPASISERMLNEHVEDAAVGLLGDMSSSASRDRSDIDQARAAMKTAEAELAAFLDGMRAAGFEPAEYAKAAGARRDAVAEAREALGVALNRHPRSVVGDPLTVWGSLHVEQRNQLLRGLIDTVLVRVGRGRGLTTPISDRVRVMLGGSGLGGAALRGGVAQPIVPVVFPDADDPRVVRVDLAE